MRASTYILRSFLRYAYNQAVAQSVTLAAKLDAIAAVPVQSVESGSVVQSVSINGQSTSFTFAGLGLPDVMEAIEYIQTLRESVFAELGGSPLDSLVYNEMMHRLQPAEEVRSDFSSYVRHG